MQQPQQTPPVAEQPKESLWQRLFKHEPQPAAAAGAVPAALEQAAKAVNAAHNVALAANDPVAHVEAAQAAQKAAEELRNAAKAVAAQADNHISAAQNAAPPPAFAPQAAPVTTPAAPLQGGGEEYEDDDPVQPVANGSNSLNPVVPGPGSDDGDQPREVGFVETEGEDDDELSTEGSNKDEDESNEDDDEEDNEDDDELSTEESNEESTDDDEEPTEEVNNKEPTEVNNEEPTEEDNNEDPTQEYQEPDDYPQRGGGYASSDEGFSSEMDVALQTVLCNDQGVTAGALLTEIRDLLKQLLRVMSSSAA